MILWSKLDDDRSFLSLCKHKQKLKEFAQFAYKKHTFSSQDLAEYDQSKWYVLRWKNSSTDVYFLQRQEISAQCDKNYYHISK